MKQYPMDKLQRPQPSDSDTHLPTASEVLVAGSLRRIGSFVVDAVLIVVIARLVMMPFLDWLTGTTSPAAQNDPAFTSIAMPLFMSWCLYVVLFSVSSWRATPGQRLCGIYIASVLGEEITIGMALGRFLVMAAPLLVFIAEGQAELQRLFTPALAMGEFVMPAPEAFSVHFTTLLMVTGLAQLALLWPLCAGNPTRILWDRLFNTVVLLRRMRD